MKRALIFALMLAACQDEVAQNTTPLPLTPDTVGHFCQMNLLEHDGPKGQVHLEGLPGAPLFFSQVSDLVVYLHLPEQSHKVLAVYVSDMGANGATWAEPGAANWTDATTAHFVIGSSVVGGMGAAEAVPFANLADARAFADARGGAVMALADIPKDTFNPPVATMDTEDDDYDRRLNVLTNDASLHQPATE